MRVERLRVGAFGRLQGLDTGEVPLPALVAVHGPNEAGKTTFFHFLTTLLYGFAPASRDTHPYAPWTGGDVEGEALLRMSGGEAWEVRRRLLSSPSGSLVRGAVHEELRNRPLPCVEHVPRAVFRQVFALTLAELAALGGESWAAVEDRLVSAMGATDLLPPREIAAALEREAGELWRPNRRGRQQVRVMRGDMHALRDRRAAALARDRDLREATRALETERAALRTAREERGRIRLLLERRRTLLPVRAQLRRLASLESEAGDVRELEGLPADPAAALTALRARGAETEETLARSTHEATGPRAHIEAYGDAEARVWGAAERIRTLGARVLALDPERVRKGQLEQELRDLERRADALVAELLDGEATAVTGLPLARLRDAVRTQQAALRRLEVAEEGARREGAGAPAGVPAWLGAVAGALGVAALVGGWLTGRTALTVLGTLPLLLAAWVLASVAAQRREQERALAARTRLEDARRAEAAAGTAVRAALGGAALRRSDPDLETVASIERLQGLLRDLDDRRGALASLDARIGQVEHDARALGRELGLDPTTPPSAAAHLLSERLREVEAVRSAAAGARRELERLARERERAQRAWEEIRAESDALESRLARLGEGDAARGSVRVMARAEARALAARLRDELSRTHADLDVLAREIADAEAAGEDWTVDEAALARLQTREEELGEEIERRASRAEGLSRDVARLAEGETADAVEGEILLAEEALAETMRERDRRWVLARLLREADRRFRDAHQPDVLRNAGRHLGTITGGRYPRILVDEGAGEGRFLLHGPGTVEPVRVDAPISTGTREQVYLALRLAIVDHLDRAGERLPLFMDEAFVNWDPQRLERGLDVLAALSERRQVFLFSCHPEMVERVRGRGARVVELERTG